MGQILVPDGNGGYIKIDDPEDSVADDSPDETQDDAYSEEGDPEYGAGDGTDDSFGEMPTDTNDFIDQIGSSYTDLRGVQHYQYDAGIIQLPVADEAIDGSVACEMVQLECPSGNRVVEFTAEREGLTPDIPDPLLDINANEVLLSAVLTVAIPVPMAGGLSYVYRCSGRYNYASQYPWRPTASGDVLSGQSYTGLPMGKMQLVKKDNFSVNGFPQSRFVTGIMEPETLNTEEQDENDTTGQ